MALLPELVADAGAGVGESPSWDARARLLYWVDIEAPALHVFAPDSGEKRLVELAETVGAVAPRASGGVVLATASGFASCDPTTGESQVLALVEADLPHHRMNDGKCDRHGRFWAGTTARSGAGQPGRLYRLDPDGSVTAVLAGIGLSNGIGWSPNDELMYYIDTSTGRIDVFDFDLAAGTLANRRLFAEITPEDGVPDGLCVDAEGGVWVALWGGGSVRRFSRDGTVDHVVRLPVRNVTSCSFAGETLADLYITSASIGAMDTEHGAGGLFRVTPGVRGSPTNAYAG